MHHLLLALGALVPMGSVALLFVYVMRAVLRADRDERAALAAYDAQVVIDATAAASSPAPPPRTAPEGVVVGDVVHHRLPEA